MFRLFRFLIVLGLLVGGAAYLGGYWRPEWLPPPPAISGGAPPIEAGDARQRAQDAGRRISEGAAKAATKLEEVAGDGALTAKIKSKMALDDYVDASTINVDTKDGVVTLQGTIASAQERERAVQLARETKGVTRVEDKLTQR